MHCSRLNEEEKKLKKELRELKEVIQKEIDEYNKKYSGPKKFCPEAIKLRNNIAYHENKYYYIKSQLVRSDIHEY